LEKRLKKGKQELEGCRRMIISQEIVTKEAVLWFKVDRIEEQIDIFWRQRAHVNWLSKGDRNTAFFHQCCKERRHNRIGKLKKANGGWAEEVEKQGPIPNYFKNLFRSQGMNDTQQLLNVVVPRVTSEMNEALVAPFSEEEVSAALNSIGDLKAPGPDGMPSIFYKQFWDIIGNKSH
jgi:hypothetical protein